MGFRCRGIRDQGSGSGSRVEGLGVEGSPGVGAERAERNLG